MNKILFLRNGFFFFTNIFDFDPAFQACFTPLMKIGTITSTSKRSPADCLLAAGGPSLKGRNVSRAMVLNLYRQIKPGGFTSQQVVLSWDVRLCRCYLHAYMWKFCFIIVLRTLSPPVCFKVFDVDRDGVLSRDELHEMVVALLEVWKDNRTDTLPVSRDTHTLILAVHYRFCWASTQLTSFKFVLSLKYSKNHIPPPNPQTQYVTTHAKMRSWFSISIVLMVWIHGIYWNEVVLDENTTERGLKCDLSLLVRSYILCCPCRSCTVACQT